MFLKHTWHFNSESGPAPGAARGTGQRERNELMLRRWNGRSRRDSVCCGPCRTSPQGKPTLSPPGEGGQNQRGPTAPLSLPFPRTGGLRGAQQDQVPVLWGLRGQDGGPSLLWPPPGQLCPLPAAPAPQQDTGQTPWCALGAAGDMLLLAGNSDLGRDFLRPFWI